MVRMEINASNQLEEAKDRCTLKVTTQMKIRGVRAANELRNASNLVLRGQRHGRVYKVPHTKRHYTASAPGEPPAVRTGVLRQSFMPRSKAYQEHGCYVVESSIYSNVKYAKWLDEGTKNGRLAARPYRRRVQEKAYSRIKRIYDEPYDR